MDWILRHVGMVGIALAAVGLTACAAPVTETRVAPCVLVDTGARYECLDGRLWDATRPFPQNP